jgi:glutamate racemase
MPQEDYLYFGDSKNAPYGSRETAQVLELTEMNIDMLVQGGAKAVVIACNTATSAAAAVLREKYSELPIIGIEPALKPAVSAFPGGRILVLATEVTLREEKFNLLNERFNGKAQVFPQSAPYIVELVEKGLARSPLMDAYLKGLTARYEGVDAVVLGCTHFPFARDAISRALPGAVLFDGGEGTARETARRLRESGIYGGGSGKIEIKSSDPAMIPLAKKLLEE